MRSRARYQRIRAVTPFSRLRQKRPIKRQKRAFKRQKRPIKRQKRAFQKRPIKRQKRAFKRQPCDVVAITCGIEANKLVH